MVLGVEEIIKRLRQLYMYLWRVRGYTLEDELRLIMAIIFYTINLGKGGSLGFHVPGTHFLKIKTHDGYLFYCRPKTTDLGLATLTSEFYELVNWFIPYARGVVLDVGANIGGYTVRACRQADLVIAIEPQSEVFNLLKMNVNINCKIKNNVVLIKKAIGGTQGKAVLKVPIKGTVIDSGRASISSSDLKSSIEYKSEEVEVDTLDNIISSLNIDRIDFIKMDIEGAEAIAFEGMKLTLKTTKYVMIEIQPSNKWLIDEFKKLGFKLIDKNGMNYFFSNPQIL